MLIYENRTPDGTLNKLNDGKCQRNQTQEHNIHKNEEIYCIFFLYKNYKWTRALTSLAKADH